MEMHRVRIRKECLRGASETDSGFNDMMLWSSTRLAFNPINLCLNLQKFEILDGIAKEDSDKILRWQEGSL